MQLGRDALAGFSQRLRTCPWSMSSRRSPPPLRLLLISSEGHLSLEKWAPVWITKPHPELLQPFDTLLLFFQPDLDLELTSSCLLLSALDPPGLAGLASAILFAAYLSGEGILVQLFEVKPLAVRKTSATMLL